MVNTSPLLHGCATIHSNVSVASSAPLCHSVKLPSDLHAPRMSCETAAMSNSRKMSASSSVLPWPYGDRSTTVGHWVFFENKGVTATVDSFTPSRMGSMNSLRTPFCSSRRRRRPGIGRWQWAYAASVASITTAIAAAIDV